MALKEGGVVQWMLVCFMWFIDRVFFKLCIAAWILYILVKILSGIQINIDI